MRDLALTAAMLGLLPLAVARPFVGVLLWSWISFMNPHREVWGFAGSIPWAAAVFVATMVGCFVAGEPRRLVLNAVTWLVILLMACFTVTSLFGLAPPERIFDKWQHTIKVMLGLLLTAALLTDLRRVHALIWIMVISIGYYGFKGGVFAIMTAGNYRIWGPPGTMIGDNNHIAAAMLVALPLMNYLRMQARHAVVRWSLAAVMAMSLLAAVASYSRGALIGLAATTVFMWLRSDRKLLGGIVLGISLATATAFMPDRWVDRMNTIQNFDEDRSASDRIIMWTTGLQLALDRPLVGSGFAGPYTRAVVDRVNPESPARAVHSIWFETLGEHGFPTFFVWLSLNLAGAWYAWRLTKLGRDRPDLRWARDLGRMSLVSMVAYATSGTFLTLCYWDYFWTLLVVAGAAHALVLRQLQEEQGPVREYAWQGASRDRSAGALQPGAATSAAVRT
jgi:probable O-glycosylation ligase (exosortase A-associated)